MLLKRHRDDSSLGEVLYCNTYRESHSSRYGKSDATIQRSGYDHTHSHTLGHIVQCYGKKEHCRASQSTPNTLGLSRIEVDMRHHAVKDKQREHTCQEAEN